MNDGLKCGLFLIAGIALGALGAVAVSKGKLDLRPMAADLMSRGMDIKDAILGKFEAVKEDLEDMAAAARQQSDKRKTEAAGEQA
ncbi:MAG: hypothetical protein J5846_01755 [Desulfovibrio sp.]|nr:hypothetical protein [Desulfovibrio sp.]